MVTKSATYIAARLKFGFNSMGAKIRITNFLKALNTYCVVFTLLNVGYFIMSPAFVMLCRVCCVAHLYVHIILQLYLSVGYAATNSLINTNIFE